MTLKHPRAPQGRTNDLVTAPLFSLETETIPRHRIPDGELPADVAYQLVHDELMLDGKAGLNVATFVSTWMEPQAEKLMAECFDKNMIDKDEYPQTAEIEMRCVNMLGRLLNAPDAAEATGCLTTGSSEAAMLGGLALKRRWQSDGPPRASRPTGRTSSWGSTSRSAGRSSPTTGTSRCALWAARAALALQRELAGVAAQHPDWPPMRVGVNSGEAVIREIGGDGHVAYPLVGDTVNTGSRLESLAPAGGVLIGETTYVQLPAGTVVAPRSGLRVKGKDDLVDAYLLLALP